MTEYSPAPRRWIIPVRILLGAVLVVGGFAKLGSAWAFAESIANYRLFPAQVNQLLGVVLPWWEVTAGTLLCLGLWERSCGILSAILFAGFAAATGSALLRHLDIACGCFGTESASRLDARSLALEGLCLVLSLLVVAGSRDRDTVRAGRPAAEASK